MTATKNRAKLHLLRRKEALLRQIQQLGRIPNEAIAVLEAEWAERERRELGEIEAALERIERDTWGAWEICGGPIGTQRLTALPEARLCLACREGTEHNAVG